MIATNKFNFKALLAGAALAFAFGGNAVAAEVSGVRIADTAKVGGKELVLNGLGVRTKVIFKVYVAGIYLSEKKNSVEDILKAEGPRRVQIVMMRDVTSDEFGNQFMAGINNNSTTAEKSKIITQISKFGEMFALLDGLKKGDVLDLDYTPGVGMQCHLNGKKIGEVAPTVEFTNAVMKIWLGEKPVDASLKAKLVGANTKK